MSERWLGTLKSGAENSPRTVRNHVRLKVCGGRRAGGVVRDVVVGRAVPTIRCADRDRTQGRPKSRPSGPPRSRSRPRWGLVPPRTAQARRRAHSASRRGLGGGRGQLPAETERAGGSNRGLAGRLAASQPLAGVSAHLGHSKPGNGRTARLAVPPRSRPPRSRVQNPAASTTPSPPATHLTAAGWGSLLRTRTRVHAHSRARVQARAHPRACAKANESTPLRTAPLPPYGGRGGRCSEGGLDDVSVSSTRT